MKAVAVHPRRPNSAHLREDIPEPNLDDVAAGRGVLVKVLRVGLDGTDAEINKGEYGAPPPGEGFLIAGHESFGVVEEVGPNVHEVAKGDHVVCMVRRPGASIYDVIGTPDMTTDEEYHEHGINLLHGFLRERYVDEPQYLIRFPSELGEIGHLLEPTTVIEKGITQAYEIQRRLKVWRPERALVLGAGTIGLLATMGLRLRGVDVTTAGLDEAPYLNSDLAEALGARYISTKAVPVADACRKFGPFDVIFEATGYSPIAFQAMEVLGKNGVLVLSSVTGGHRVAEVPADVINLSFVLGNKVMVGTVNASREHFEAGVRDLALCAAQYPGWLERLNTHPVKGLENFAEAYANLGAKGVIKTFIEVAPFE